MATFGKITNGASSSNDTVDNKIVSQATPGSGGTVVSLTARIWVSAAGTCNWRGVIYSDTAGEPDALLAVTDDASFTNTTEAENTATFSGANLITLVSGTPYWIGVHYQDPGSVDFTISRDATATLRRTGDGDTWTGGATNPFGTTNVLSGPIDVYVTYTEGGAAGPANVKTVNGLAIASVKTVNGLAIASVKTINGLG